MARTRSARAKSSGQDPSDHETGATVDDPTQSCQENRPQDQDQMEAWMRDTRTKLLEYLRWCRCKVEEQPTADKIREMNEALDKEWRTNWAPQTDVQTGEIYDQNVRDAMFSAMQPRVDELSKFQRDNETNKWHVCYQKAQNYWDDFFYYQIEWNRRFYSERPGGSTWAIFLVDLYSRFEVGSRSHILEVLGPDQLHQYPDGLRSCSPRPSAMRRRHLREKFPQSAVRLDHDSIEERRAQVNNWRYAREDNTEGFPDSLPFTKSYSATAAQDWRDHDGNEFETSWESRDWGAAIANVERVVPPSRPDDRPRYKTSMVNSLVRTFVWKAGKNSGRDHSKPVEEAAGDQRQFLGHYINELRYERHFVLDEHGRRVLEDQSVIPGKIPRPTQYQAPNASNRLQGPGRQDRARLRVVAGAAKDWHNNSVMTDDSGDAEFSDDQDVYDEPFIAGGGPDVDRGGLQVESDGERAFDEGGSHMESDDEHDLFALSYRGLPLPKRPATDSSVRTGICSDKADTSDLDDGKSRQRKKSTRSTDRRVTRATSKFASKDIADDKRISQHKPSSKAEGETFEAVPGDDDWDLATYTHTFPDGTTFTQRTLVPALKTEIAAVPGKDPPRNVYPDAGVIPANAQRATPWQRNPDFEPRGDNRFEALNGRWDNEDDQWVSTVIIRSFRVDNNAYYNCSINPHFDAVMKGDKASRQVLQEKHITSFNRAFQQVYRRSDRDVKAKLDATQCGSWTVEELNVARRLTRSVILNDGLIKWNDDWISTHCKVLREEINAHRLENGENEQERRPRTQDSVTSKFKRYLSDVFQKALGLKARIANNEEVSDDLLKPRDILGGSAELVKKGKTVANPSDAGSGITRVPPHYRDKYGRERGPSQKTDAG